MDSSLFFTLFGATEKVIFVKLNYYIKETFAETFGDIKRKFIVEI